MALSKKKELMELHLDGMYLHNRFSEGGGICWLEENHIGLELDRNGLLCLEQYINVMDGDKYIISGMLKAENITHGSSAYRHFFLTHMEVLFVIQLKHQDHLYLQEIKHGESRFLP